MKVLIAFYSQTGKTKTIAQILADNLEEKGAQVKLVSVEPIENKSYQANIDEAKKGVTAEIKLTTADVSAYDIICIGTPVWASAPAPAVNGYISQCKGVAGKKVVCFATHE